MAEDTMFQEAVEALRQGNKARARELLTMLLKTEQTNADYWVWMSAAVDASKERIYCLQTALKLDPANTTAKRGLVLLGALPADETATPFPLTRPRAWEQKMLLAHELPKPTGVRAFTSSPIARLAGFVALGVLLVGGAWFGMRLLPQRGQAPALVVTLGTPSTFTPTPTLMGAVAQPSPTFIGPTPLWAFLPATYTPTPLYLPTQRQPQSSDQFRAAKDAYYKGDWETFIMHMEEIARLEPESADVLYFIGEAYRFQGKAALALETYNEALKLNDRFGPAYLGLARASLMRDPNAEGTVDFYFEKAIEYAPAFGEIYLERADYHLYHERAEEALFDLTEAEKLMPGSPLVYYGYARAYEMLGDIESAIESAEKAYELDITMLPVYLMRGELYMQDGSCEDAVEVLTTYINYEPEDGLAFALLGECYYRAKEYETAIDLFTKAIRFDPTQRQIHVMRAFAYLETGEPAEAQRDFDRAIQFGEETFEIKIGEVRAYYAQEKFGSAYQQAEGAMAMAETDEQTALALYWRALANEGRGAIKEAIADWKALLEMPLDAMTEAMRLEADEHLRKIVKITPSATPKPVTPTKTRTPAPTRTPGKTTPTRTPTRTPTPTP